LSHNSGLIGSNFCPPSKKQNTVTNEIPLGELTTERGGYKDGDSFVVSRLESYQKGHKKGLSLQ
jgi:hypothetical protein